MHKSATKCNETLGKWCKNKHGALKIIDTWRRITPIHLTSVLGVLGTQETFCIVIAGLFERDSSDLHLPEFDKPWVIHLRETCCCSTNLCTWRPNPVYKNRRVRRHHIPVPLVNIARKFWFYCISDTPHVLHFHIWTQYIHKLWHTLNS
jgi:hypothetical protein